MIGRWSELRVVRVRHSVCKAMWEEATVRVRARGDAGRRIEEKEVGDCERICN